VTIDQDKDVLAAEYVLGTLGRDERAEAQALIAIDPAFAAVVRGWERRLGELSAMVDPVEPPADMWDRIKAGVTISDRSAPPPVQPAAAPMAPAAPPPAPAAPLAAPAAVVPQPQPAPEEKPAPAATEPPAVAETVPPAGGSPVVSAPIVGAEAVRGTAAGAPELKIESSESRLFKEVALALDEQPRASPPKAEVIDLSQRVRRWRGVSMMTGTLAACLAALVALQLTRPGLLPGPLQPPAKVVEVVRTVEVPTTRPAEFVAVFQKDDASPAFLLTVDVDKRQMTIRRVGAEAQPGKSYELWLVSDKFAGRPRSLGVIGGAPYTVRQAAPEYDPVVINRATYAISLEPEGGSPTGSPTGPVLYHGRLLQTTAPDFPARTP
jgi:anti-sigma-K factor RskA